MQTHVIKLNRPLRNAAAIPVGRVGTGLPGSVSAPNVPARNVPASRSPLGPDDSGGLTATVPDQTAKSSAADSDIASLLTTVIGKIETLDQHQTENLQQLQELAIHLATQIASAILQYEVHEHETRIRNLLSDYLRQHDESSPVIVRLHPQDAERLGQSLTDTTKNLSTRPIKLKPDTSLALGDCALESEQSKVVANWQRQLSSIEKQLLENLHHAQDERNETAKHHPGS